MSAADLIISTDAGLYCPLGGFHVDPWKPVARAVITHAHADHARGGSERYLVCRESLHVLRTRLGAEQTSMTAASRWASAGRGCTSPSGY